MTNNILDDRSGSVAKRSAYIQHDYGSIPPAIFRIFYQLSLFSQKQCQKELQQDPNPIFGYGAM